MALQALVLPLVSVFRSAGFNEAIKALKGLDGSFKDVAKSAGFAAANFAAAGVLQNVTQYIDEAVVVTQKFERNMLALSQVFESNTGKMRAFTQEAVNMGISQSQAAQASVFLGSVLKQYGVSASETTTQTQKLVSLSQDLATTFGYDLSEALTSVTALFRGEYDPIEKFGVAMKQSEINALLAARGQDKLTGSLLMQASVQARLDLLYERSADAFGAFERAGDTLYVAQQKLNAALQNQQIAFGQGLQKPLAETTDLFAELATTSTDMMESLGTATGNAITLLNGFLGLMVQLADPVIGGVNTGLTITNNFFEVMRLRIEAANEELEKFLGLSQDEGFLKFSNDLANSIGAEAVAGNALVWLNTQLENSIYNFRALSDEYVITDGGAKRAAVAMRGVGYAARDAAKDEDQATESGKKLEAILKAIGTTADAASGSTSSLTKVFNEIENAVAQSEAKTALEGLGLSAGLIEKVLTQPNWEAIFKKISRLAYLTSIDLSKVFSITALGQIAAEKGQIAEYLSNAFKTEEAKGGPATEKPRDTIKAFFNEMRDEVNKQAASIKLAAMGASEGLIDLILGNDDWMKLWLQIKTGVISLAELQRQFNSTAAGADELAEAMKAAADAKEEMLAGLNDKLEEATQKLATATEAAKDLEAALKGASTISILPTVAKDIGQFESQIQGVALNVSKILKEALDNGSLLQADYDRLTKFANDELATLEANARQRDELYKRYSFTENIIKEYRAALTGALSLTSLFNKLTKETEKRTVTEVQKGIVRLGDSVKTFGVTISKSYEESIDKVTDKTGGLLDGFRKMAEKSRAFAQNLRTLKEMNLDPKLFAQLVDAGVEAGGETAQAIVDGGKAAVDELGSIYNDIDKIGGKLGLDMAPTFYNAGDKLMESLLSGIKAQQTALETSAKTLAAAFSAAFQSNVTIAVQVPVTNASNAVTAATNAISNVNTGAIERINAMLLQATEYFISSGLTEEQVADAGQKIGAYNALLQDLMSGQITDISGISAAMTSADLRTAALATGGTNVTNYYNVEVNASGYAGGVQAGQAVIEEIINFERNNGSSGRFLIQAQ
jgi:hypothetical protein